MKKLTQSLLASFLIIIAAPAFSKSGMEVIQIYVCEFNDDATAEQLLDVASVWLKAAKKTGGGKNINVGIRFPIAEGESADGDFKFVITAPSFTEWGEFADAYEGSEVERVDEQLNQLADCGQSTIWEGMLIE